VICPRDLPAEVARRLPRHPNVPATLLQGAGPRTALLEEFRRTPHCVLFATAAYRQ
jgi:hypothetical protein